MIGNEIRFWVEERPAKIRNNGTGWELFALMGSQGDGYGTRWVLKTWENRPTEKEVDDCKRLIIRAFAFYHHHLEIPRFEMHEVGSA